MFRDALATTHILFLIVDISAELCTMHKQFQRHSSKHIYFKTCPVSLVHRQTLLVSVKCKVFQLQNLSKCIDPPFMRHFDLHEEEDHRKHNINRFQLNSLLGENKRNNQQVFLSLLLLRPLSGIKKGLPYALCIIIPIFQRWFKFIFDEALFFEILKTQLSRCNSSQSMPGYTVCLY